MNYEDSSWYILSIKPKQEFIAERNLEQMGVEVYLPLYEKKQKKDKKKIDVVVPLFAGYIFAKFEFGKFYQKVRYTRGVKNILGNKEYLWIIDESKIEDIKNREEDGLVKMKIVKKSFSPGDRIIVDEGDFDGWEGIFVEDIPDEKRAIIMLTNVNYTNKLILPKEYLTINK
ncbi:MAG: transcription termination/antitermination NusG family protein [Acidobacteriota bacterium]